MTRTRSPERSKDTGWTEEVMKYVCLGNLRTSVVLVEK